MDATRRLGRTACSFEALICERFMPLASMKPAQDAIYLIVKANHE
jgi:hypothetical protein